MNQVYLTLLVMFGNGAMTGLAHTILNKLTIRTAQKKGTSAWFVAGLGATTVTIAVCPTATSAALTTISTTMGSDVSDTIRLGHFYSFTLARSASENF